MQRDLEGLRLNSTDVYTFCLWGPSQFCDLAKWRMVPAWLRRGCRMLRK